MTEIIKKNTFLELIRSTHNDLELILGELTRQSMEEGARSDEWRIKDIVYHVAWYEAEMITVLEKRALQGSDWWDLPLDQRNELIYLAHKNELLQSVIDYENSTFEKLMNLLETASEEDLNDPTAFAGMPSNWQPWSVLASNTYEHYPEHIRQIKDHLEVKSF